MASSPKVAFVLLFLLFSLQTDARDSQFFSKVSRNRDTAPSTTTTATNALPSLKNKEEEEEPTFTPQTTRTGYGLYGHETGLNPPSTTTVTSLDNMDENNVKNYATELKGLSVNGFGNEDNTNKFKNNGVEMYYAQGAGSSAGVDKQGISGKSNHYHTENDGAGYYGGVEEQEINAPSKHDNSHYLENSEEGAGYYGGEEKQGMSGKNNYYYGENDGAGYYGGEEKQGMSAKNHYNYRGNEGAGYYGGVEKQGMIAKNHYNYRGNEGAGYYGGVEKQGMSDTRFLENGKYFYDINAEKKYDTNPNYIPYRGKRHNANYENNYNNYDEYNNKNDEYNNRHAMKGYKN